MRLIKAFIIPTALRQQSFVMAAGLVVGTSLIVCACWVLLTPTVPPPPTIPLDGVEKAVADAITSARNQVEEQPRAAEAWGQLGQVLLAHNFNRQADQCFAQAEKLDGTQPHWPYYQGLLAANDDHRLALYHLRRAVDPGE